MSSPTITVLLPVYNCAEYLPSAIKSILKQTFEDYEFLIIDDGSEDNTKEIVNSFNDTRINYIIRDHVGLSATLNYGLKISSNEWIARQDGDDISHPLRLENQVKYLKENCISSTWAVYFKNYNPLYCVQTPTEIKELKQKLALHCIICHSSVFYNKTFILKQGGYNKRLQLFEDYDLWLRLINKSSFYVIPEVLCFVRVTKNSLSRKDSIKNRKLIYEIQRPYYKDLQLNFGIKNSIEMQILRGWRELFWGNKEDLRKNWNSKSIIFGNIRSTIAYLLSLMPMAIIIKILDLRLFMKYHFFYKKWNYYIFLKKRLQQ